MNICPGCEAEIDHGLELGANCAGADAPAESGTETRIACLELEDGKRIEIDQEEVLLGRSDPVDQVEPDVDESFCGGFEQGVSRRHALITSDENGFVLEDLGSTNGTIVNREKLAPGTAVNLMEGDVIHLGKMKAIFHTGTNTCSDANASEGSVS